MEREGPDELSLLLALLGSVLDSLMAVSERERGEGSGFTHDAVAAGTAEALGELAQEAVDEAVDAGGTVETGAALACVYMGLAPERQETGNRKSTSLNTAAEQQVTPDAGQPQSSISWVLYIPFSSVAWLACAVSPPHPIHAHPTKCPSVGKRDIDVHIISSEGKNCIKTDTEQVQECVFDTHWQRCPVNPSGQAHVWLPAASRHVPPFRQLCSRQLSSSSWQFLPRYPAWHSHR